MTADIRAGDLVTHTARTYAGKHAPGLVTAVHDDPDLAGYADVEYPDDGYALDHVNNLRLHSRPTEGTS